jgi:hypothetical protein
MAILLQLSINLSFPGRNKAFYIVIQNAKIYKKCKFIPLKRSFTMQRKRRAVKAIYACYGRYKRFIINLTGIVLIIP